MTVRTRFAPSPTGSMHIGNVRTAAFAWLYARHTGGQFILRIEDTDRTRYVEGAVDEIRDGLKWLGIDWDEGPVFQSERTGIYREYAERLVESGSAYRCWCSPERLEKLRESQKASGQPTGYDRWCRDDSHGHSPDEPHVIRFAMPTEGRTSFVDEVLGEISFENALIDDFVMLKTDGFPTYQFANVVDDHEMGITHVIRAEEWTSSTPKHIQEYLALGWQPPVFAHVPMILGPDRSKLGKRHGAVAFKEYIEKGYLPDGMLNFLALLGWSPGGDIEIMPREELIQRFDLPGISKHPAIFDLQKMEWINRQHIRMLPGSRIFETALPVLKEKGLVGDGFDAGYGARICELVKDRLSFIPDIAELFDYFFREDFEYEEKGRKWLQEGQSPVLFRNLAAAFETTDWNEPSIEETVRRLGGSLGLEGGKVIHPIRMAATGKTVGPSLFAALEALGRERVIKRMNRAAFAAAKG